MSDHPYTGLSVEARPNSDGTVYEFGVWLDDAFIVLQVINAAHVDDMIARGAEQARHAAAAAPPAPPAPVERPATETAGTLPPGFAGGQPDPPPPPAPAQ